MSVRAGCLLLLPLVACTGDSPLAIPIGLELQSAQSAASLAASIEFYGIEVTAVGPRNGVTEALQPDGTASLIVNVPEGQDAEVTLTLSRRAPRSSVLATITRTIRVGGGGERVAIGFTDVDAVDDSDSDGLSDFAEFLSGSDLDETTECPDDCAATGRVCCSGVCIDTRISGVHCGICAVGCRTSESCFDGVCEETPVAGAACVTAADCAENLECDNGTCRAVDGAACDSDDTCVNICDGISCAPPSPLRGACDSPSDCADAAQVCADGQCLFPDSASCVLDADCTNTCINGTCAPLSPVTGPCDASVDCAESNDRICDDGKCKKPVNEPCGSNEECVGTCLGTRCADLREVNESCDLGEDEDCAGALFCSDEVCKVADGDGCTANEQCVDRCLVNVCGPQSGLGGACDQQGDCIDSTLSCAGNQCLLVNGQNCTENRDADCAGTCIANTCTGFSGLDGSCEGTEDCQDGFVCFGARCLRATGETCSANSECVQACINRTCQPFAGEGERCDRGETVDCDNGLACPAETCLRTDGRDCDTNAQCARQCINSICAPLAGYAEPCDDPTDCAVGLCDIECQAFVALEGGRRSDLGRWSEVQDCEGSQCGVEQVLDRFEMNVAGEDLVVVGRTSNTRGRVDIFDRADWTGTSFNANNRESGDDPFAAGPSLATSADDYRIVWAWEERGDLQLTVGWRPGTDVFNSSFDVTEIGSSVNGLATVLVGARVPTLYLADTQLSQIIAGVGLGDNNWQSIAGPSSSPDLIGTVESGFTELSVVLSPNGRPVAVWLNSEGDVVYGESTASGGSGDAVVVQNLGDGEDPRLTRGAGNYLVAFTNSMGEIMVWRQPTSFASGENIADSAGIVGSQPFAIAFGDEVILVFVNLQGQVDARRYTSDDRWETIVNPMIGVSNTVDTVYQPIVRAYNGTWCVGWLQDEGLFNIEQDAIMVRCFVQP
ncbi:MAG: hypothetical protein AAFU77_06275 [Myxococcota bacterium]